MCCCSVGIIIMKHALSFCSFTPFVLFPSAFFLFVPHKYLSATLPWFFATCHLRLPLGLVMCNLVFSPVLPPEVPVSSVLCLSSVRELPVQVRELYAQGFVLVAVHPFVHPCGPRHAHIQRQLHRAVLVRETPR